MPESLGRRIAARRSKLGLTQQELADRLAISRVAVSHLEAGMSDPGERTVALLAGLFKVEPHELVGGTSYPRAKADRLPLVVARHTEVEHQLGLLAGDLAWIEALADCPELGPHALQVLDGWDIRLRALGVDALDEGESRAVAEAHQRLRRTQSDIMGA